MAPTAKEIKEESKKGMPFPRARLVRQPRDMRVRQLSNILAGLNYLRAPVATCLRSCAALGGYVRGEAADTGCNMMM